MVYQGVKGIAVPLSDVVSTREIRVNIRSSVFDNMNIFHQYSALLCTSNIGENFGPHEKYS